MITFYIKGDLSNAKRFLENLRLFILAESLGAGEWMGFVVIQMIGMWVMD